ncbi:hypothetical protein [Micrococcus sp.]|uniref:hypothetical protein n=1 Tax=Micrococcus sp. TaxID=1271 RepID=UPI002A914C60|nr:hypothetical protein [Micrococcus sp.]MDY6055503.1 hypothetical protein [Micrococcus sp.]
MSIVRLHRDVVGEDGRRQFEYREAWVEPDGGPFVVHHGRVGHVGTVAEQPLTSPEEGQELLTAFAAQGEAEGFTPLAEDTLEVVEVAYRLRGRTPSSIERRHAQTLREELTHQLAWRALGEVVDVVDGEDALVLVVRTPHAAKAIAEVPAAARRADGVQPNKVEARRAAAPAADDDGRSPAVASDGEDR